MIQISTGSLPSVTVRRPSATSIRNLCDLHPHSATLSSSGTIPFEDEPEEMDIVTEKGLRHADITLEAR